MSPGSMARSTPAALTLDMVRSSYGNVVAVKDVTLSVAPGEFITLLGASGSGKSTTLMTIAGFVRPDSGRILIDGADQTARPPHRRNIGTVFQHYALFPHLTVERNVAFPLEMRKLPKAEIADRVKAALDLVQLGRFGDRKPQQLSGGQQQRVALARALVYRPPVLLLDEPLGALDKNLREEMQVEIRRLQQELGITTVSVTHDQQEAMTMSDRVVVMRDGAIEQVGSPQDVYERPANPFVASFMGAPNFIRGAMLSGAAGAGSAFETVSGERLAISPRDGTPTSGAAVVIVRPERIHIAPSGETARDGLPVRIETVSYAGDSWKLAVRRPNGDPLAVSVPAKGRTGRLAPGQDARVWWEPEDAWVVPG